MNILKLGILWACIGSGALLACGGDDGKQNTGIPKGPDEALNAKDCYLGLGVSGTAYSGYSCSGTTQSSSVSGLGPSSFDDVRMTVDISLNTPPAIGELDVESLTFRTPTTGESWTASMGSCTAKAVKSATDTDFGWVYYRIDIVCTAPATPATGNPGEPLELGQFSIVTFFTS
jgi:hypothetical protein